MPLVYECVLRLPIPVAEPLSGKPAPPRGMIICRCQVPSGEESYLAPPEISASYKTVKIITFLLTVFWYLALEYSYILSFFCYFISLTEMDQM